MRRDIGKEIAKIATNRVGRELGGMLSLHGTVVHELVESPQEVPVTETVYAPAIGTVRTLADSPIVSGSLQLINYSTRYEYLVGTDFTEDADNGAFTNLTIPDGTRLDAYYQHREPGAGGITAHSQLTGLLDDDHTQYHNDARAASWGDPRYVGKTGQQSMAGPLEIVSPDGVILDRAGLPIGLITEVDKIVSLAINVPQVGTRDTTRVGGIFRLDTRTEAENVDSYESFVIYGYAKGGSVEKLLLRVNLETGETTILGNPVWHAGNDSPLEKIANKGIAGGYTPLNENIKVPPEYLPDTVTGAMEYQGTWDAATNTPDLNTIAKDQGHYWVVNVAGGTALTGEPDTDWRIGDWAVWNGADFDKIDNSDKVSSVDGRTGAITLDDLYKAIGWLPDWTDVQNPPATYPPDAHGHPLGEVTGHDKAAHDVLGINAASVNAYGIGNTARSIHGTDLNTLRYSGNFMASRDGTTLNAPPQQSGDHAWFFLTQIEHNEYWRIQVARDFNNNSCQIRHSSGNATDGVTWNAWKRVPFMDDVWHPGNDGDGSGLDADTVDGIHASDLATSKAPVVVTADTTLTDQHDTVLVDASASAVTITLPDAAASPGSRYEIKKLDASANTVAIAASGTNTIDGNASLDSATQGDVVELIAQDTGVWRITSPPTGAVRKFTDEDIFLAVTNQDGEGSGLDADLLDGQHSSEFALVGHTHPPGEWHYIGDPGEPGFLNGWVNFNETTWGRSGFYLDSANRVNMRGLISSGTTGAKGTGDAFILPVGYRPAVKVMLSPAGAGTSPVRVDVHEDGTVIIVNAVNTYVSLGGVTFRAEA